LSYVTTLDVFGFDNQETATEFALAFSKKHNIVESSDWANLRDENAKDGFPTGNTNPSKLKHNINRMIYDNPMSKMRHNAGTFKKGHQQIYTEERNKKIRKSKLGKNNPNYGKSEVANVLNVTAQCNVCGAVTNKGNISRWHNANCKKK